ISSTLVLPQRPRPGRRRVCRNGRPAPLAWRFPMRPTFRRVVGPVLATVALHAGFLAVYLGRLDGDPSALVCAGENRIGCFPYEAVTRACGPSGHDGQFYYALARAPWQRHGADIDLPAYRHVRILYPALCWALSAGDPVLLLYVMPAVNLL